MKTWGVVLGVAMGVVQFSTAQADDVRCVSTAIEAGQLLGTTNPFDYWLGEKGSLTIFKDTLHNNMGLVANVKKFRVNVTTYFQLEACSDGEKTFAKYQEHLYQFKIEGNNLLISSDEYDPRRPDKELEFETFHRAQLVEKN